MTESDFNKAKMLRIKIDSVKESMRYLSSGLPTISSFHIKDDKGQEFELMKISVGFHLIDTCITHLSETLIKLEKEFNEL